MELNDIKEHYGSGWISLYRSIKNHWLYPRKRMTYLEAWIHILIEVNHSDRKVLIGYDVIECKRGESIKSLETWAKEFKWSVQNVRTFFKLLKSDSMIDTKGMQKSTWLSVCKYDSYQSIQQGGNKEVTTKQQGGNKEVTTNNNDNNINKENKIYIPTEKDFCVYGLEYISSLGKNSSGYEPVLKSKYASWKDNKWKDGNNNKIKNWKTKLQNSIPYLKPIKSDFKNIGQW